MATSCCFTTVISLRVCNVSYLSPTDQDNDWITEGRERITAGPKLSELLRDISMFHICLSFYQVWYRQLLKVIPKLRTLQRKLSKTVNVLVTCLSLDPISFSIVFAIPGKTQRKAQINTTARIWVERCKETWGKSDAQLHQR
jgi:hypothetical protein